MITKEQFKSRGGKWLGKAREWIKNNCLNGASVTWGSRDILQETFTVEDFAAEVAFAAVREESKITKIKPSAKPLENNPARENLALIKEIEAKGEIPIFDSAGWVVASRPKD